MLQSQGLQTVRHEWVTKEQQHFIAHFFPDLVTGNPFSWSYASLIYPKHCVFFFHVLHYFLAI